MAVLIKMSYLVNLVMTISQVVKLVILFMVMQAMTYLRAGLMPIRFLVVKVPSSWMVELEMIILMAVQKTTFYLGLKALIF